MQHVLLGKRKQAVLLLKFPSRENALWWVDSELPIRCKATQRIVHHLRKEQRPWEKGEWRINNPQMFVYKVSLCVELDQLPVCWWEEMPLEGWGGCSLGPVDAVPGQDGELTIGVSLGDEQDGHKHEVWGSPSDGLDIYQWCWKLFVCEPVPNQILESNSVIVSQAKGNTTVSCLKTCVSQPGRIWCGVL